MTDYGTNHHLAEGRLPAERDPTGRAPSEPGSKLDDGKIRADLMFDGFSRALTAVANIATYGATKYSPNGWRVVPDGEQRYRAAGDRHRLARGRELRDPESGFLHLAHETWNRLAELELFLDQRTAGAHPEPADVSPQHETRIKPDAGKPAVHLTRGMRE